MTIIAFIGWVINFHSSSYFKSNAQISNTLGALGIGIAANMHARFGRHVENWWIGIYEGRIRPQFVKVRKLYRKKRYGLRGSAVKVQRSQYEPTRNGSQPHSRASSVSE